MKLNSDAEADRVGGEQLRILEMPQHLPRRGAEPFRAHEAFLARQHAARRMIAPASDSAGEREEAAAPADEIGEHARDEAAAEAADARARDVDAGDAGDLRRRPFVADIGDGDGEDRRQQQALHEAPDDERLHVAGERRARHRHHHGQHGGGDHALAPEHVGDRAGERRGQRDRRGARGHDGADLGGADAELARQRRQQRLRRIEVDEGAEAGGRDGELAGVEDMRRSLSADYGIAAHGGHCIGRAAAPARACSSGRAGGIDARPVEAAEVVALLRPRHGWRRRRRRRALRAPTRATPGGEIGGEEQAVQAARRGFRRRCSRPRALLRSANTASTMTEWPAATTRRALSASVA